jgi:tripartite-type tricarboxylate transporter receptor subunit TctC
MRALHKAIIVSFAAFAGLFATSASAQEWPKARPVTLVVPFAPGGGLDVVARLMADHLSTKFDAKFVVENRSGASGNIGAAAVARAAPDGYTFLFTTPGPGGNNKFTFASIPFDPETDFTFISKISESPLILVVRNDFPAKDLKEFIAHVKANPGKVTAGNPGVGSVGHIGQSALADQAGLDLNYVPYKGGTGNILPDLYSGALDSAMDLIGGYVAPVKSNRLRMLAVAAEKRSPVLPEVPTMKELGIDFVAAPWFGFQGPKGLPKDIVQKMNAAITDYLTRDDRIRATMASIGQEPAPTTPEAFEAGVKKEMLIWGPVIKKYNIRSE